MSSPLPSEFRSLYRLFLRTSSASVLHHKAATRNLRALWRPMFDAAVGVTRTPQEDPPAHLEREAWLNIWNKRADNTLALLYASAKSRGLPHRLTRNLAYLVLGERQRLLKQKFPAWDPLHPPTPGPKIPKESKRDRESRWVALDRSAAYGLGQVVQLAQARDGLCLGKIALKGRRSRRQYS